MLSNLWRQRRETDGRLIEIWKEVGNACTTSGDGKLEGGNVPSSSGKEGNAGGLEDLDLCLSEDERENLQKLEQWYLKNKDNMRPDTTSHHQGTSYQQEDCSNSPAGTSMKLLNQSSSTTSEPVNQASMVVMPDNPSCHQGIPNQQEGCSNCQARTSMKMPSPMPSTSSSSTSEPVSGHQATMKGNQIWHEGTSSQQECCGNCQAGTSTMVPSTTSSSTSASVSANPEIMTMTMTDIGVRRSTRRRKPGREKAAGKLKEDRKESHDVRS